MTVTGDREAETAAETAAESVEATLSIPPAIEFAKAGPPLGVRGNRDFAVMLVGQGFSSFGDAVNFTALPLLVILLGGSGLTAGLVGLLQTLPDLVFGLPAGALADRWDRRRTMFLADLGRGTLTALIPVAFALGLPTLAVVLLVTFPINVLRVFWMAAYTASVPALVGRGHVAQGTAAFEALYSLGFILGPAVAGWLAFVVGPAATIAVTSIALIVSALSIFLVRRPLKPATAPGERHIVADIREGVGFIRGHRALRAAILIWGLFNLCFAPIGQALTFSVTEDRGLGSGTLGFILSMFGIGALIGSLVAGRLVRGRVGPILLGAPLVSGLFVLVVAAAPSIVWMAVAVLGAGAANTILFVTYASFRVTVTPDAMLGRVGSMGRMISFGLQPVGFILGGIIIDATSGTVAVAVIGLATIAIAGTFALSPALRGATLGQRTS